MESDEKQPKESVDPAETAPVDAETAPAEAAAAPVAPSRRPLMVVAGVAALLLVATVALGVLFARERSAHDESDRDLRAETARAAQVEKDLAAVRAQRADLESKLAAAEAQQLSPEAKLAIVSCVKAYAELERIIATVPPPPVTGGGTVEYKVYSVTDGSAGKVCGAAEPHIAKIS